MTAEERGRQSLGAGSEAAYGIIHFAYNPMSNISLEEDTDSCEKCKTFIRKHAILTRKDYETDLEISHLLSLKMILSSSNDSTRPFRTMFLTFFSCNNSSELTVAHLNAVGVISSSIRIF